MEKKEKSSKLISSLVALSLATTLGVPTIALADTANAEQPTATQQQMTGDADGQAATQNGENAPSSATTTELSEVASNGVITLDKSGSYTISKDLKSSIIVAKGTNISLTVVKDVTLTNTDGQHTITNNGTLTIIGEGTVDNVSHGCGAIVNKPGATATIKGCTFRRSQENGSTDSNSGGNSWYTIKNYGRMVIEGGATVTTGSESSSLEQIGKYSSLVANGWQNAADKTSNPSQNDAIMEITGGAFSGGLNTIKNDDCGSLTISGGSFANYTQAALQNHGVATVSNGEFGADSYYAVYNCPCDKDIDKGELTIAGGDFKGSIYSVEATGFGFLKVTGGTFTDPGVYRYAESGTVNVQLLKDYSSNDVISIGSAVKASLDLNGHTMSVPDCGITTNGALTLIDSANGGILQSAKTPVMVVGKTGVFTLDSGSVVGTNSYGIYAKEGGSAVINGGLVKSKYAAFAGNNTTGDMNFTVNGGTLTAEQGPAINMPGQVNLTLTGGTLNGGISLRMGQVNISGGTINAILSDIDSPSQYYNYSGCVWFPDALYVIGGTYDSNNTSYGNSLDLNISGGEFNCNNDQGSAIAIYDLGKVKQNMKVNISGNAKLSAKSSSREAYQVLSLKDIGVENPQNGFNNADYVGKVDTAIIGGTFSSKPDVSYIASGYEAVGSGPYTVQLISSVTPTPSPTTETTTTTNPDGTTTTTVTDKKTGESTSTTEGANGTTVVEKTDASGNTTTDITVPEEAVDAAAGAPVEVPSAIEVAEGQEVSISAPAGTVVAVPVSESNAGNVVVIVHADGTETVIPMSLVEDGKVIVQLDGNETIKIVDNAKEFTDVADDYWAAGDIDFASSHEIFKGIGNGDTYEPETALTRNMMMTVLARTAGADTSESDPWYAKGQEWAVENGVSNGLWGEDNITREQLVTMLFNFANFCGLDTSARADVSGMVNANVVSDWATEAVQWAVAEGILKGVDNIDLAPQGLATRAQAAAFMQRYVSAALL